MQEIPSSNKNKRLEQKDKHIGGSVGKKESIYDGPKLDKRGLSISDYR